jgi:NAD(P)-dependent dehydrogenase (short-subunit alcohol dehydrogenase family)
MLPAVQPGMSAEKRMEGKVAIVTGSTRGIGRATALRFAREGARVVVTGRTEDAGREVEEEIRAAGGEGVFVPTDLAREDDVVAMVSTAMERYGALTTLVNNAAPTELMGPGRLDRRVTELENDAWDSIMLVALKAVIWSCKHAIPAMIESAKSGFDGAAIVNISSAASILGTPGLDTYTAAKGALNALTRSLAVEYAPDDIRVNCIVSGMVLTSEGAWKMMDDPVIGGATKAMHLTRLGMPDDIANAALFLASDESAFVTGAVIPVDGGVTARMPVPDISAADLSLD